MPSLLYFPVPEPKPLANDTPSLRGRGGVRLPDLFSAPLKIPNHRIKPVGLREGVREDSEQGGGARGRGSRQAIGPNPSPFLQTGEARALGAAYWFAKSVTRTQVPDSRSVLVSGKTPLRRGKEGVAVHAAALLEPWPRAPLPPDLGWRTGSPLAGRAGGYVTARSPPPRRPGRSCPPAPPPGRPEQGGSRAARPLLPPPSRGNA